MVGTGARGGSYRACALPAGGADTARRPEQRGRPQARDLDSDGSRSRTRELCSVLLRGSTRGRVSRGGREKRNSAVGQASRSYVSYDAGRARLRARKPLQILLGVPQDLRDSSPVATFVLIPGAGTEPGVYGLTIEVLEARGHRGVAPPLPLHDQQAGPSDHADAIATTVAGERELVVVAQSLGAFTGPLVSARVDAAALVLMAPMIPRPGETAGEWWGNTGHADAVADLLERHGPMGEWGPEAMADVFLHDVDPDVARDSARFEGAPGPGMFTEPWPLDTWPDVTTRVLAPTDDRLFPLEFQRRVAHERLGLDVDEIGGGHLPMLSRPVELADCLIDLAAADGVS